MLAFFSRIIGWLAAKFGVIFGQGFLVEVARWTATKLLLTAFLTVGIYIIANNLIVWMVTKILEQTSQFASQGTMSSVAIQLTGLGAYLADQLLLAQSFALIITGFSIRAIRQFLPF